MTCEELASQLDAFLDDELSVGELLHVQAHLGHCEVCQRVVASELQFRRLIEADALRDQAPAGLRERITREIRKRPADRVSPSRWFFLRRPVRFFLGLIGTAGSGVAVVVLVLLFLRGGPGELSPLATEVVAKHRLYSRAEASLHLATVEADELARWLVGQLPFRIKLPVLARPGEQLLGGRVTSVADAPAAYLLYKRDGRRLSLLIFRVSPDVFARESADRVTPHPFYHTTAQGRTVLWWEDGEVYYAATGEGTREELVEFALLCVRGRTFQVSDI